MVRFLEVVERALTGPICLERNYDLRIFNRKLMEVINEHDIRYDPENPIPSDDNLADEVYEAALEFYSQVGTYCLGTERIIKFDEKEIKEAMRTARSSITLGEGRDEREFVARKPESKIPPWCSVVAGTRMSSEDLFLSLTQAVGEIPLATGFCMALPNTVHGMDIRVGSPLEIYAAVRSVILTREGLRRAGRPGLPIMNAIAIAVSDVATIAGGAVAVRPSDAYEVSSVAELKIDLHLLNKVAHALNAGGKIVAGAGPVLGGYCGGPEGVAVATTAYTFMGQLVQRGIIQHPYPVHYRLGACNSTRDLLWAQSLAYQAISRNTHIPIMAIPYVASGPSTEMRYYETATTVTATVVSGAGIEAVGSKQDVDEVCPLDPLLATEVAHAVPGMKREDANEIVKELLQKYEDQLAPYDKMPRHKKYQECFDVEAVKPFKECCELYKQAKREIANYGIPLE